MEHTKGPLSKNQKWTLKPDQLATDCCPLDSAQYPLSIMKFNPQTDKSIQTIKDRSTPLKKKCLNDVIQAWILLSTIGPCYHKKELGFQWIKEWMKTELSQQKLKSKP